jgi:hypothetical protein
MILMPSVQGGQDAPVTFFAYALKRINKDAQDVRDDFLVSFIL